MAEREGHRGAERGHLRERQVHEDHVALEHVEPEVRVDADERHAGEGGQDEEFNHRMLASVRTL